MTWTVSSQFTTLNPAVGCVDVPEWSSVTDLTKAQAQQFFKMWTTTKQFKKRTVVLWKDDKVVEVKFV